MNTGYIKNGEGFVEENRLASKVETEFILTAMESFGIHNADAYKYHLYGRYDAPYGWYLFGVEPLSPHGDENCGKFLILGDCLDVLPDYNKLLTLAEVHEFAFEESDGRFDAVQEWGLFKGITDKLWHKATDSGVEFEHQCMKWDDEAEEWKIIYIVRWDVCDGLHGSTAIRIPANLPTREDADRAFIADFKNVSVTEKSAEVIVSQLEGKKTVTPEKKEEVWVLTIIDQDGNVYPEVHKRFSSCVDRAIEEMKAHTKSFDAYDVPAIQDELRNQMYWEDPITGFKFDLVLCPVCD